MKMGKIVKGASKGCDIIFSSVVVEVPIHGSDDEIERPQAIADI